MSTVKGMPSVAAVRVELVRLAVRRSVSVGVEQSMLETLCHVLVTHGTGFVPFLMLAPGLR